MSAALEDRILRNRKLALLAAVADYEGEFGEITVEACSAATTGRQAAKVVYGVMR